MSSNRSNFIYLQDTNAECEASCTNNGACVGYDLDNNLDQCWIHEDQNNFDTNTNTNANGVTQYRKIPCGTGTPGVCVVTYISTDNKLSFGGTRDTSAVSRYPQHTLNCNSYNRPSLSSFCIPLFHLTYRTQILNAKNPVLTMLTVLATILTIT